MLFQIPYAMFNYKTYIIFLVASLAKLAEHKLHTLMRIIAVHPYGTWRGILRILFIKSPILPELFATVTLHEECKMRGTGGMLYLLLNLGADHLSEVDRMPYHQEST